MSVNNQMYKMYNEMIKGYKEDNDGLFEHGVRCWMDLNPENPFPENEPAFEYFFLMQKGYSLWKMGAADRKINRRRMLEAAYKLCECNPKRPYRFDKKAEEAEEAARIAAEKEAAEKAAAEEKAVAEAKAEEEHKTVLDRNTNDAFNDEFNKHVFGVIPDESDIKAKEKPKRGLFNKLFKKQTQK